MSLGTPRIENAWLSGLGLRDVEGLTIALSFAWVLQDLSSCRAYEQGLYYRGLNNYQCSS